MQISPSPQPNAFQGPAFCTAAASPMRLNPCNQRGHGLWLTECALELQPNVLLRWIISHRAIGNQKQNHMGLFSNLKKAIFKKTNVKPKRSARRKPASLPQPTQKPEPTAPSEQSGSASAPADSSSSETQPDAPEIVVPQTTAPESAAPDSEQLSAAELTSQLDQLEKEHPEDLAWRTSIVDLMKLVEMDSSYDERKEMALDLGYSQSDIDSKGSAEMNMWLHKKVMAKLSEDTDGDLTTA